MGNNRYTLNLHYNSKNFPDLYNDKLFYHIAHRNSTRDSKGNTIEEGFYLLALYDEAFPNSYCANRHCQNNGTYYGTITNSFYHVEKDLSGKMIGLKFLVVYSELGKDSNDDNDGAKFALGELELKKDDDRLILKSESNGLRLYIRGTNHSTQLLCSQEIDHTISKGLDYNKSPNDIIKSGLFIPKEDIDLDPGKDFNDSQLYALTLTTDGKLGVIEYDINQHKNYNGELIGHLNSKTTLIQDKLLNGQHLYALYYGDPFDTSPNPNGIPCGLENDSNLSIFRDQTGKFIYEFVTSGGKSIVGGEAFCQGAKICKMENLNLIPNIRTHLKSMLVSADIGDIKGTGSVDATAVALNLKSDTSFGKLVLNTRDSSGKTIPQQINENLGAGLRYALENNQEFKNLIAGNKILAASVATELASNPNLKNQIKGNPGPPGKRGPRGHEGPPGSKGEDASVQDIAAELLNSNNHNMGNLGRAVLDAKDS